MPHSLSSTASPPIIYSLSPVPSPNGEGSENYYLQIRKSLSPSPSPNGEGSEDYYLQIKRASLQCKEGLSSIGRNALLKWRWAFPSFCSFVISIRVTMLLCLNNMSLKQYVTMALCLKHLLLSTLILCYYVFKSMSLK